MINIATSETSQESKKKTKKTAAEWEEMEKVVAPDASYGEIIYLNSMINTKIFCAVTPKQRLQLKETTKTKTKYVSDVKLKRVYQLEGDFLLVLDGPVLCMFDASVFFITVSEYILSGATKGKGRLEVSLREIARMLGYTDNSSCGKLLKRIYESYRRLNTCEIILTDENGKEIWFSRPISELDPYKGGRNSCLKMKLSDDIVDLYLIKGYRSHPVSIIKGMTQLEQLLYISYAKSSNSKISTLSEGKISKIAPSLYEKTNLDLSKKGSGWIQEEKSWEEATPKERKSYYALIRKTMKNIVGKVSKA